MNAYDGFEYPWSWSVKEGSDLEVDLTKPLKLIGELKAQYDIPLMNFTMGTPYKNPHVKRPTTTATSSRRSTPTRGLAA